MFRPTRFRRSAALRLLTSGLLSAGLSVGCASSNLPGTRALPPPKPLCPSDRAVPSLQDEEVPTVADRGVLVDFLYDLQAVQHCRGDGLMAVEEWADGRMAP